MIKSLQEAKTKEDVYEFLRKYTEDQLELSRRTQIDSDNFTLPAWSEFQAYQLGMQKLCMKLLNILPDPEKRT